MAAMLLLLLAVWQWPSPVVYSSTEIDSMGFTNPHDIEPRQESLVERTAARPSMEGVARNAVLTFLTRETDTPIGALLVRVVLLDTAHFDPTAFGVDSPTEWFSYTGLHGTLYQSDEQGRVVIEGPGAHALLSVESPPYCTLLIREVSNVDAENIVRLDKSFVICGQAMYLSGAPVAGVEVGLFRGPSGGVPDRTTVTRADGRFFMLEDELGDLFADQSARYLALNIPHVPLSIVEVKGENVWEQLFVLTAPPLAPVSLRLDRSLGSPIGLKVLYSIKDGGNDGSVSQASASPAFTGLAQFCGERELETFAEIARIVNYTTLNAQYDPLSQTSEVIRALSDNIQVIALGASFFTVAGRVLFDQAISPSEHIVEIVRCNTNQVESVAKALLADDGSFTLRLSTAPLAGGHYLQVSGSHYKNVVARSALSVGAAWPETVPALDLRGLLRVLRLTVQNSSGEEISQFWIDKSEDDSWPSAMSEIVISRDFNPFVRMESPRQVVIPLGSSTWRVLALGYKPSDILRVSDQQGSLNVVLEKGFYSRFVCAPAEFSDTITVHIESVSDDLHWRHTFLATDSEVEVPLPFEGAYSIRAERLIHDANGREDVAVLPLVIDGGNESGVLLQHLPRPNNDTVVLRFKPDSE